MAISYFFNVQQTKMAMAMNMTTPHTQITINNTHGIAATQRHHDVRSCLQKIYSGTTGTSSSQSYICTALSVTSYLNYTHSITASCVLIWTT